MRQIIVKQNRHGLYDGTIIDEEGRIESATTNRESMHDIHKWLDEHDITTEEFRNMELISSQQEPLKDKLDYGEKKSKSTAIDMKGEELFVGDTVLVDQFLTSDPNNKRGETGKILSIEGNLVEVEFNDGVKGFYQDDTLSKKINSQLKSFEYESDAKAHLLKVIGEEELKMPLTASQIISDYANNKISDEAFAGWIKINKPDFNKKIQEEIDIIIHETEKDGLKLSHYNNKQIANKTFLYLKSLGI